LKKLFIVERTVRNLYINEGEDQVGV